MINVSRLYCGAVSKSDGLRYGRKPDNENENEAVRGEASVSPGVPPSAAERRPVVVWNLTRSCNLRCIHCYTDSEPKRYSEELTTQEALHVIEDLAAFGVPAVLFSGGEPLLRKDLLELATYARRLGLRLTLSTNGTLLTEETAQRVHEVGFTYVGISLDGVGAVNDKFRGMTGAFERAVEGFRNCRKVGQRVGLRMTLTRHNVCDLHKIFDFIESEGIQRACFYHLVYSGRGRGMAGDDLTPEETRRAMDIILERTKDLHLRGKPCEVLTVDNHADGVYVYLKLLSRGDPRAEDVYNLLKWNGGGLYSSGIGIADIDFRGDVHPDQFWMHYSLGNVKQRPFSQIWTDECDPLLYKLRRRKEFLTGRCARCRFLDLCGGAMRVRAEYAYGDPFTPDPACYLTDEEVKGVITANENCVKLANNDLKATRPTWKPGAP